MAEYRVPRLLWESLESVLLAQGRLFVKDLAKRLEVPEKELLKRVMPSSKINVYLHDTHTDTLQCRAHVQVNNVTSRCRMAVAIGSEYCKHHITHRPLIIENSETMHLQKIADGNDRPPLWVKKDGVVINSLGECMGTYDHDTGRLVLYSVI